METIHFYVKLNLNRIVPETELGRQANIADSKIHSKNVSMNVVDLNKSIIEFLTARVIIGTALHVTNFQSNWDFSGGYFT